MYVHMLYFTLLSADGLAPCSVIDSNQIVIINVQTLFFGASENFKSLNYYNYYQEGKGAPAFFSPHNNCQSRLYNKQLRFNDH